MSQTEHFHSIQADGPAPHFSDNSPITDGKPKPSGTLQHLLPSHPIE